MSSETMTDVGTWRHVAAVRPKESWFDRATLAAHFIRPGDIVCDLGAGAQPLREVLPRGVGYIAVDCVAERPGTHIADFNATDFTLPTEPFTMVTALGVFNYMDNLDACLSRLAALCEGKHTVFTYDFWPLGKMQLGQGVKNGMESLEEGEALFSKYVRDLRLVTVMRRRAMFTGVWGRGGQQAALPKSATKIACEYVRPLEYLAIKLSRLRMMPRWLA